MNENQKNEWKESWRDEYLKWVCGFANAEGGVLTIGKNDKGKIPGIDNAKDLREKTPVKTRVKILQLLSEHPEMTLASVAETIGKSQSAVERAAAKLVKEGRLEYVGPQKGGYWEVLK